MKALRAAQACYLGLLAWQPLWHAAFPPPLGNRNLVLAAVAAVPLLLPLKGVVAGSIRSLTWAGYLAMLYLVVGITEAWANPDQRLPALAQAALVAGFVAAALAFSRRPQPGP